jgi:hypothetical protein
MANKADIKAAILDVAGNPSSGAIADLADDFAEAVFRLDNPVAALSTEKETRVTKPTETR